MSDYKKQAVELTFHSSLLQVLQNETCSLMNENQVFVHNVKQAGNKFIKAIDQKIDILYRHCESGEADDGQKLIELITAKIEEAKKEYKQQQDEKD